MKLLWKTMEPNFESRGHKWEIGKWYHVDGEISTCQNGFHASPTILDAMGFVTPGWICRAKVKGQSATDSDKSAWSDMMIVSRCEWTKEMSVELAIYAAKLVLPIFEKKYPDDKRPRHAIEAAKAYLKNPSSVTMAAAGAAAWDARAAAWDAGAAARAAAWAAAGAAGAAAGAAAWDAAWDAARAAEAAAWDAGDATLKKIDRKIKQLIGYKKT